MLRGGRSVVVLFVLSCGGLADSDQAPPVTGSEDQTELAPYSRETDTATAECYQSHPGEVAFGPEQYVGCWERIGGADERTLNLLADGRFFREVDGGDYFSCREGLWEPAAGGAALLPPDGLCSFGGADEACQRVGLNTQDADLLSIREVDVNPGPGMFEYLSTSWRRVECTRSMDSCPFDDEEPESACRLEELTPLPMELARVEVERRGDSILEGSVAFFVEGAPPGLPRRDVQEHLMASVLAFTLMTREGQRLPAFRRHVLQERIEPGDFTILHYYDGPRVLFLAQNPPSGSEPLSLTYEIANAKYWSDTGLHTVDVSILESDP